MRRGEGRSRYARRLCAVSSVVRAVAGIASLLPLGGVLATAGYAALVMIQHDLATHGGMLADPIGTFIDLELWQVVLAASLAIALLQLVLMVAFSAHALTRKRLGGGIKAIWVVAFYLIGFAALPAYWFLHMLVEEPAS
jgi:hypothetical protein